MEKISYKAFTNLRHDFLSKNIQDFTTHHTNSPILISAFPHLTEYDN